MSIPVASFRDALELTLRFPPQITDVLLTESASLSLSQKKKTALVFFLGGHRDKVPSSPCLPIRRQRMRQRRGIMFYREPEILSVSAAAHPNLASVAIIRANAPLCSSQVMTTRSNRLYACVSETAQD